ncbi:MAG: gamma-glutamylcyclotransferase [Acidimicrobiia bacterium]|nr:gamma-glutamylcyclotransferase [Acidimicrobiia bacterium]
MTGDHRLPFAFYGTLRPGGGALERLGITRRVTHLGPCLIGGDLYAVTWHPGLVAGAGEVRGDLFDVPADLVATLDGFEGYRPDDPATSPYLRVARWLLEPAVEAWVYLWRGPTADGVLLPGGDWLDHAGGRPLPADVEV